MNEPKTLSQCLEEFEEVEAISCVGPDFIRTVYASALLAAAEESRKTSWGHYDVAGFLTEMAREAGETKE